MTVKDAINSLKATRPGAQVTDAQLIQWLSDTEGYITNEVLSHYKGSEEYVPFDENTDGVLDIELIVEAPYSSLYTYRLQAMVDYNNADSQRFTNSMYMYNSEYKAWMDNFNRQNMTRFVGVKAI